VGFRLSVGMDALSLRELGFREWCRLVLAARVCGILLCSSARVERSGLNQNTNASCHRTTNGNGGTWARCQSAGRHDACFDNQSGLGRLRSAARFNRPPQSHRKENGAHIAPRYCRNRCANNNSDKRFAKRLRNEFIRFSFEFKDGRAVSRADGSDNASFVRTNLASTLNGDPRRFAEGTSLLMPPSRYLKSQ